jgi:hypothetical protein
MIDFAPAAYAIRASGLAAFVLLHACGADAEADDAGGGGEDDGGDGGEQVGPDAGDMPGQGADPFWFTLSEAAWLEPRMQHTAVWTGGEMIVWGGVLGSFSSDPIFDDGGRYDPATDSWQPTTEQGAPAPRAAHTAVWTGAEMIVWGGAAYDVEQTPNSTIYSPKDFQDGGRYDPRTDSWRSIDVAGAPLGRYWHHAVWTGTEMIVFGGHHVGKGTGIVNDGGIFDPATDTWRPIDNLGVPPEIDSTTDAIWTGSELLVLAISYSFDVPYVLARYDAANGSWSVADMSSAPDVVQVRAAWTGSELIVWGRAADMSGWAGGRYDPATDSWRAMSSAGAPSVRSFPTLVWTGSRALLWGGRMFASSGQEVALKTGGAYDPVADAWEDLPLPADDVGRGAHTAVWTGSEMIVWGGVGAAGIPYLNDGTRYRP